MEKTAALRPGDGVVIGVDVGPAGNFSSGVDGVATALLAIGQDTHILQSAVLAPKETMSETV